MHVTSSAINTRVVRDNVVFLTLFMKGARIIIVGTHELLMWNAAISLNIFWFMVDLAPRKILRIIFIEVEHGIVKDTFRPCVRPFHYLSSFLLFFFFFTERYETLPHCKALEKRGIHLRFPKTPIRDYLGSRPRIGEFPPRYRFRQDFYSISGK